MTSTSFTVLATEELSTCTVCSGLFDMEKEGGSAGFIGILPVQFCPTCVTGIMDFADQQRLPVECPHCGKFEDDE